MDWLCWIGRRGLAAVVGVAVASFACGDDAGDESPALWEHDCGMNFLASACEERSEQCVHQRADSELRIEDGTCIAKPLHDDPDPPGFCVVGTRMGATQPSTWVHVETGRTFVMLFDGAAPTGWERCTCGAGSPGVCDFCAIECNPNALGSSSGTSVETSGTGSD